MITQELELASRSSRLLGQIVDGMVGAAPLVVLLIVLDSADLDAIPAVRTVVGSFGIAYYLLADALPGGQSLGKRWLGMSVIDERNGAPCSLWQSLVRNALLLILGPLDWLFIFGARHQRLGDKAAHTIVVHTG